MTLKLHLYYKIFRLRKLRVLIHLTAAVRAVSQPAHLTVAIASANALLYTTHTPVRSLQSRQSLDVHTPLPSTVILVVCIGGGYHQCALQCRQLKKRHSNLSSSSSSPQCQMLISAVTTTNTTTTIIIIVTIVCRK